MTEEKAKFLAEALVSKRIRAVLLTDPLACWQFARFYGGEAAHACIIPYDRDPILLMPPGSVDMAKENSWVRDVREFCAFACSYEGRIKPVSFPEAVIGILDELGFEKGIIGIDEFRTSFSMIREIEKCFPNAEFVGVAETLNETLGVNSVNEIQDLNKASQIAVQGVRAALDSIREGVRECEVAAVAAEAMFRMGAEHIWYPPQILSGYRSAYPIGSASEKTINKGDLIQIDLKPVYRGSLGDIARVAILGESTNQHSKLFNTVVKANQAAISKVAPGVRASEIDRVAREIIDKEGYAGLFKTPIGHPLGGIYGPYISSESNLSLREGMAFSIEPGIYIPGFGGVRIEDDVLVTKEGSETLTSCDRNLKIV